MPGSTHHPTADAPVPDRPLSVGDGAGVNNVGVLLAHCELRMSRDNAATRKRVKANPNILFMV